MTTRWKIIGKAERRKPKDLLGRYDVPNEAVDLAQDIARLEQAEALLRQVNHWNITGDETQEQRDFGCLMLSSQLTLIRSWIRVANRKLAQRYLAK
jgi:hypothetical protein